MDGRYQATAVLCDGTIRQVEGGILECANWAENVIRANSGEISIVIRKKEA